MPTAMAVRLKAVPDQDREWLGSSAFEMGLVLDSCVFVGHAWQASHSAVPRVLEIRLD